MTVEVKITVLEATAGDAAETLAMIARQVRQGFTSGIDFSEDRTTGFDFTVRGEDDEPEVAGP